MNKEKKNKMDWREIRASFVAIIVATIVKHLIFTDKIVTYSLWKDFLLFLVLYIPVYAIMLFIQGKFKIKK